MTRTSEEIEKVYGSPDDECLWCHAHRWRSLKIDSLETQEMSLGPFGCCAPDGDDHTWIPMKTFRRLSFTAQTGILRRS